MKGLGLNGDYTPTENMVSAGREFMPRNVSEESVVRAFMEMMKQGEIDGVVAPQSAEHQRDLLGEALGMVLIKVGMLRADAQISGPELLMAAETFCELAA